MRTTYTVVGLLDLDTDCLLVAGVFVGQLAALDVSANEGARYQRWAERFVADSAADAEQLAREAVQAL